MQIVNSSTNTSNFQATTDGKQFDQKLKICRVLVYSTFLIMNLLVLDSRSMLPRAKFIVKSLLHPFFTDKIFCLKGYNFLMLNTVSPFLSHTKTKEREIPSSKNKTLYIPNRPYRLLVSFLHCISTIPPYHLPGGTPNQLEKSAKNRPGNKNTLRFHPSHWKTTLNS